jgi:hypothetical protein
MSHKDVVVVVADALRLRAIRLSEHFRGRVLYFSDSNLASAFESVRAHEPGVVALEGHFAHTPAGLAFAERLQNAAPAGLDVQLIMFTNGAWSVTPLSSTPAVTAAPAINTRRVPRFPVVAPLALKIDGQQTNLIDMSIMGAQVLSTPALRPSQKLKITLPDEGDSLLSVSAFVAWSAFELPSNAARPHYRAGMEFTDAAVQALEAFCKRHCGGEPLPIRR